MFTAGIPANWRGALAGNRVASRVDASRLTAAFTVLLIPMAAYSLTRSLPRTGVTRGTAAMVTSVTGQTPGRFVLPAAGET